VLYATLSVATTLRVPVHHAGDAQNIAGRIAVIAIWWAMEAGIQRDGCRRKFRLPRTLFALAAAIVA